jgi:DNA-binding LacI/PurR family transcriptional regulator
MTVWFRRVAGLDTETMREVADAAGVSWSTESIVYRGRGIGYADGDAADETAIQDAAESLLGYRPRPYDPPARS